jgi:cell wall-associated NlpC family hydrolase
MRLDDLVGKPFKPGACGPDKFDCWGLAREVWSHYGEELPDYRVAHAAMPGRIEEVKPLWIRYENGEIPVPSLVAIRNDDSGHGFLNHVGVYIGNGQFIHAVESGGVQITRINHPWWRGRIEGFYTPRR